MRQSYRLLAFGFALAVATPAGAQSANNDTLLTSVVGMITDASRWHVSAQGGTSNFGNFLLQQTQLGTVAVRGARGWTLGGGGGFDIDDNSQVKLNYNYTSSQMMYRDWTGTGSNLLNINNLGKLSTNVAQIEVEHYFVGSRSLVSPYAGFGVAGVWNHLAPDVVPANVLINAPTQFLETTGGNTKFGFAATANLGAQIRLMDQLFTRLEWATMGTPNPFTGNRHYNSPAFVTFDQPSRVSKTEYRVAAVWYIGKQAPSQQKPTVATSP